MKLCELHPKLSAEERQLLAEKAGTDPGYLWQLATRWRDKRPSLDLIRRLSEADKRLTLADMVKEFSEGAPTPSEKERA